MILVLAVTILLALAGEKEAAAAAFLIGVVISVLTPKVSTKNNDEKEKGEMLPQHWVPGGEDYDATGPDPVEGRSEE